VWADPGRIQQVFLNLLSNAIKFTPRGGKITLRSKSGEDSQVVLSISDTGVGIEGETLSRLFSRSSRGSRREQPSFRRSGAGAFDHPLARADARRDHPRHQQGLRPRRDLRITLPTIAEATARSSARGDRSAGGRPLSLRILLVEDHDDSRRVLAACSKASAAPCSPPAPSPTPSPWLQHSFDLLVSDIGLPDGSGMDIMRNIRGRQNIKGIALSGSARPKTSAAAKRPASTSTSSSPSTSRRFRM